MPMPALPAEYLDLPDDQLGLHLWAWWLADTALKRGISVLDEDVAENIRVATLGIDTENASLTALEKVLKKAASGDMATAGRMLRNYVLNGSLVRAAVDEAVTGKRKQRAIARMPRHDGLQALIIEIVTQKPKIKQSELLEKLRLHCQGEVIDSIDDAEGVIEWKDKNHPAGLAPISGLKDRLSRAKKYISSL